MTTEQCTSRSNANQRRFRRGRAGVLVVTLLLGVVLSPPGFVAADERNSEKKEKGGWYVPPLPLLKDRMQSVHAALLPSGKVLTRFGSPSPPDPIRLAPADPQSAAPCFQTGAASDGSRPASTSSNGHASPTARPSSRAAAASSSATSC